MVDIIGLTTPPRYGLGYPVGDWTREDVTSQSSLLAFYTKSGELFDAGVKYPNEEFHGTTWWYVDTNHYPIFNERHECTHVRVHGTKYPLGEV